MFCKNKSLVNAMIKAGFTVEEIPGRQSHESMRQHGVKDDKDVTPEERTASQFVVKNGNRIVTWYVQGDRAHCVHCSNVNDQRDLMTDYFPGSFAHTIKGAVEYLKR